MITNFEEYTADLSPSEIEFAPTIKNMLLKFLTNNSDILFPSPIKQDKLIVLINNELFTVFGLFIPMKLTTQRLQKYFNYFRSNGMIPIIATQNGCYITKDKTEIEKQVLSLEERARSILKAAEGMKKFLH